MQMVSAEIQCEPRVVVVEKELYHLSELDEESYRKKNFQFISIPPENRDKHHDLSVTTENPNVRVPSYFLGRRKFKRCDCYLWPAHPCPALFNDDRCAKQAEYDALLQGLPGGGGGVVGLVASCVFGSAGFGLGLAFVVFLEFFAIEFIV